MKKLMFLCFLLFVASTTTGCMGLYTKVFSESGVHELGKVGDVTYHSAHADHLVGPNMTALVRHDTKTGKVTEVSKASGDGIARTLVNGVASVGAAYWLSLIHI